MSAPLRDVVVHGYASREAWAAARRDPTTLGASEVAAALGVHPHMEAWALWEIKRTQREPERAANAEAVLQRGHRWEAAVLAEYEDASGCRVVAPSELLAPGAQLVTLARRDTPWLRESPDAFATDARTGELGHVEAKTALYRDAWSPEQGVLIERWDDGCETLLPPHYAVQAYVQLAVTSLPWNDVCALVPHGGWLAVRWVRLLRDEDTQGQIVEAAEAWRARHLLGDEPPPVDGSRPCNRFLARAFQPRDARVATSDEAAKLRELAAVRAQRKALEARADVLANELVAAAEGARLMFSSDAGAPYGQPQASAGRTTVDVARLRKEFPDAFARCSRVGAPSVSFNTYRFEE